MTDYETAFWKLKNNWHESVKHYEDRIEQDAQHIHEMYELVAAMNAEHTTSKTRIEKLEAALREIAEISDFRSTHPMSSEADYFRIARKALDA